MAGGMMLEFHDDAMLRLLGRQPNWMAPKPIPAGLDALLRWPALFRNLPQREATAVREACAAVWCTGWTAPDRRDVADLVAEIGGEIDLTEYRRRMRLRYPNAPEEPSRV
ncbi:hypothetical protein [Arthrobacter sp. 3Tela_A]|uniref:antitoxin VbhA family protein n=1 Tax=Arthrobacter sp. 3Tela_A TaxID=3093743 RepID=UPI003BB6E5B0